MSETTHAKAGWIRSALERFEAPLLRYAFRITGDPERARDVVQDCFLSLCRESPARIDGHLAPWLFRVCRNRALDVLKKEARTSSLETARAASIVSAAPLPSKELETAERTSLVVAAMAKLPANQQEVLRLRFQNDLSYREVSEITGLSVSNVGFLIHQGLRSLRGKLAQETTPIRRAR